MLPRLSVRFIFLESAGEKMSDAGTRVALIGIVVSDKESVARLNELLHDSGEYIIGRMGIPYEKAGVSIISVAIDAPQDVISALSGRLGALKGVTAKTVYQKLPEKQQ